jgi:dimethylamine/trimethylamine dehydrogenase
MARDRKYDILFEPVEIGPKTLKNRFYQVPHCTGFGVAKPWSQARHRSVKAEGGWAAVCTEFCSISEQSDEAPLYAARLWDDNDVAALALMCDEAHAHGALSGVELHHGGVHSPRRDSRLPSVAPSQLAGDFDIPALSVPKAMDRDDMRRLREDWVAAAERATTSEPTNTAGRSRTGRGCGLRSSSPSARLWAGGAPSPSAWPSTP